MNSRSRSDSVIKPIDGRMTGTLRTLVRVVNSLAINRANSERSEIPPSLLSSALCRHKMGSPLASDKSSHVHGLLFR